MNKTTSSIGILSDDGIRAIYCGWNGDAMHDGSILLNCWDTPLSVAVLVSMGNLISLGPNLESTITAHRDCDTSWMECAPRTYAGLGQWRRQGHYFDCGCYYLFNRLENRWSVFDASGREYTDILEFKVNE